MKNAIKKLFEKKRYSFVGKKHTLKIDEDIWTHTMQYVTDEINIMKRHGSAPNPPLTAEEFKDLVYVTAKYPQQVRNLQAKVTKGNDPGA
jgi:hypothetical protein